MTGPPRISPGTVIWVAGPDTTYVVTGLETHGADAVLHLRTEDGRHWTADRRPREGDPTP